MKLAHPSDHSDAVVAAPTIPIPPSADDILSALGLARKRSRTSAILTGVGYVAAGALVGSALTLLFAPTSGAVLRARLSRGARGAAVNMKNGFIAAGDSFDETPATGAAETKASKSHKDGDGHRKAHRGESAE